MVVRVWRGRTRSEHAAEYADYVFDTGVADERRVEGNRGAIVLQREVGDATEILVVSLWESMDAVRAFAGEDYESAVYYPKDERWLLELEPGVRHYRIAGMRLGDTEPAPAKPIERARSG